MFMNFLHWPDDTSSQFEPHYSSLVAEDLARAYKQIRGDSYTPASYIQAAQHLTRHRRRHMSRRQRMRVFFILALGHSAAGAIDTALASVDEALTLALKLNDPGATVELAYLRGTLHAAQLEFREAVADHTFCLEQLAPDHDGGQLSDPTLLREIYIDLAFHDFSLAQFEASRRWLSLASRLLTFGPEDPLAAPRIAWAHCLLARWSGDVTGALGHGIAAHAGYSTSGSDASQARILTVLGDVTLDHAERFPVETAPRARQSFVTVARPYIEQAVTLARQARDGMGVGQAQLAYARLQRLAGIPFDGVNLIETVLSSARQANDIALLSQAYTAMGDELTHHGSTQQGLSAYRKALDMLAESDIPVMAQRPRRALLYASEMSDGS